MGGQYDEAARVLASIDPTNVDRNDLDFLQGTTALGREDFGGAIPHFRAVLARDPTLNRVRLDLAYAHFRRGDDTQAERLFRAALAEDVPPEVRHNVEAFLDELRRRREWEFSLSAAMAPDTNINAATTAQSVDLFGLPFQLDPAARQTSGVGLSGAVTGSYQWELATNLTLRTGGAYYAADYSNATFDDHNVSAFAGPRILVSEKSEISVLATAAKRWFGNRAFSESVGGRIEGALLISSRLHLSGTIFGHEMTYDGDYASYSGPAIGFNTTLTYALNAHSSLRGLSGITWERAAEPALRDTQYSLGAGYYHGNLPFSLNGYAEVRATYVPYGAPLDAFGKTRADVQMDYRLTLSARRLELFGFTPLIGFTHTDRYSNIALYSYARNRVEFGMTRAF